MTLIQILHQVTPPFTHKEKMPTETPLATHTYSIMILINQDSVPFKDKYTALLQQELEFTQPNSDQKLPNFQGYGDRDNATCNVFHR